MSLFEGRGGDGGDDDHLEDDDVSVSTWSFELLATLGLLVRRITHQLASKTSRVNEAVANCVTALISAT